MQKIIVLNYKMNGDEKFYREVQKKFNKFKLQDTKIILCPPFVYLPNLKINNKMIDLGSQDIANKNDNRSTGQISSNMLEEFGVKYSLIGHVERKILGEDINIVKEKISNAVENNIQPIICIDKTENLKDLENVIVFLLKNQKQFNPIFAYEPSCAIDSDKVASVEEINEVVENIKSVCKFNGFDSKVIYGGGVDLKSYLQIKTANVDGFLLGSVSLDIDETISLIKEVEYE